MNNANPTIEQFWDFSLAVYQAQGVESACLELQDEHGVNVNLLLLLCWCLQHGHILTLQQWQILKAAVAQSEQDLHLHRKRRREAKHTAPVMQSYYRELKQQELALEQQQQQQLITCFNNMAVAHAPVTGINGSVPAFIHLYKLRERPSAIAGIKDVITKAAYSSPDE